MSYPCHYTNLCPHKPHKHAHTHTHTHTQRTGCHSFWLCCSLKQPHWFLFTIQYYHGTRNHCLLSNVAPGQRGIEFRWLGGTATHGLPFCLHSTYSRFPETSQRRKWARKVKKHKGRGLALTNDKRRRNVSVCWSPHCRRMRQLLLLTVRYRYSTH